MRKCLLIAAVLCLAMGFLLPGCDPEEEGQFPDAGDGDLEVDADVDIDDADAGDGEELEGALRRPVEVFTDEQGMPHIYAETLEDLFYVNGYIQARDRLAQMEFYRRVSTGTLSEILGGFSDDTLGIDILFRMLGLHRTAKEYWEQNYDSENESHIAMESFAEGVNAFLQAWRDGDEEVNTTIANIFPQSSFRDWEPADTLAIGRLLAVDLTYYAPVYLELTQIRQALLETFPEDSENSAIAARSGLFNDVVRFAPAADTTHIDGFPQALTTGSGGHSEIDADLLANALKLHQGLTDIPGMEGVDFDPFNARSDFMKGSNNWVVSGDHTESGYPQVANDPHLGLSLPTVFYPMQLNLTDDLDGREDIDILGAAYVGVPGVVIGRNHTMAWGTTVGFYDYVDLYQEQITGSSDDVDAPTVLFNGEQVSVERVVETIGIGQFGAISEEVDYTVEIVPHHGPLIPPTEDARPVPREGDAISVKWVGLEMSNEVEFLMGVWRADTPADIEEAMTHYRVGSSNFVFGFSSGEIYYSGRSDIPIRSEGARTFDPRDNIEGTGPMFVLPGDGSAEWEGFLSDDLIPHALNPEKGYVITANNDPVGVTLDNDPVNAEHYLGGFFDLGFRAQRIEERIEEFISSDQKLTLEDHIAIQDDPQDPLAARMVPHIAEAIDIVLDSEIDDDHAADLASIRTEIDGQEATLAQLRELFTGWDFVAPATREPAGEDVLRSSAATLFNVTMVYLFRNVYGDEMARLGLYDDGSWSVPRASQVLSRSLLFLLETPEEAVSFDPEIGDSLYFDDLDNEEVIETRLTMLVRSVLEAHEHLTTSPTFGSRGNIDIEGPLSAATEDWVWGNLHGLFLNALVPGTESGMRRPQSAPPFYERPGGTFSVSPCGNGYTSFNFTCGSGSSLRMVHDLSPDGIVSYNAVPGGASQNPDSPYFDDQIERWNRAEPYRLIDDRDELEQVGTLETFDGQ